MFFYRNGDLAQLVVQVFGSNPNECAREREKYPKIGPLTKKFLKGCILIIQGKKSAKE